MRRFVTTITIILMVIGIIAPIAWRLIEKRTSLSFNLLSATSIVDKNEEVVRKKLTVTFNEVEIGRLVKYEFNLVNAGNTPIDASLVKNFPNIKIPQNTVVLQTIISHTNPPGVQAKIIQSESPLRMAIEFELLNQGDSIYITLYADGDLFTTFEVGGRVVGLKQIDFNDYSGPSTNQKIVSGYERYQEIVTPIFSVIFTGLLALVLFTFSFPRRTQRKRLGANTKQLTSLNSKSELVGFIEDFLYFYPGILKRSLVDKVNNSDMKDGDIVAKLHVKIIDYLLTFSDYEIPCLIGGIIGASIVTVIAFMKMMQ